MATFIRSQATVGNSEKNIDGFSPSVREHESIDLADVRELHAWNDVFNRLGISHDARLRIAQRAALNHTSIQAEFLASGLLAEETFYRSLAETLGVDFAEKAHADEILASNADCVALLGRQRGISAARLRIPGLLSQIAIATDRLPLRHVKARMDDNPALRPRFRVVPRRAMRTALLVRCREALCEKAVHALFAGRPDLSARFVVNGWQGGMVAVLVLLAALAFIFFPFVTWLALHLACSMFFLACVGLRGMAAAAAAPNALTPLAPSDPAEMPVYSVLVALHKEAGIVPELLVALGSLLWPRSKLEIKLVCEADDRETLDALQAQPLKPWVEIIEVPAVGPRTKPKALNFALPTVSGEFVVLYDAEDRPHPAQLIEAWQKFRSSSPKLACLQAPLEISNREHNFITAMFGVEYSALFNGLLPFLSNAGLLLPLGGTSNHFRRSALQEVGAWDPYNVTEDADLGVRLARFGYRTGTLTRPTFEPAPDCWKIWLPQRTRWFKGWCQTWLAHMRAPWRLWAEVGPASFWVIQVLFAGLILSAVAHPLMLGTIAWSLSNLSMGRPFDGVHSVIFIIDMINISLSYSAFLLLGWRTLAPRERKGFWKTAAFTPIYWMALSLAAARAIHQLARRPHHWEKTPHFSQTISRWSKSASTARPSRPRSLRPRR